MQTLSTTLFLTSVGCILANLLAVLSVVVYSRNPPPFWMAYPIPPLVAVMLGSLASLAWSVHGHG